MSEPPHRLAHVQGLRALAVVIVVAYHARLGVTGGFVGVDVFFVVSGFVISRLLQRDLETNHRLSLADFFSRRTRRLLPALTLTTLAVCALSALLLGPLGPQQQTSHTATGAGLFAANLQLFRVRTGYFDLDSESNALLHTWSLGVEEQFYLVFPLALLAAWRIGARRKHIVALVTLGSAVSFALAWFTSHGYLAWIAHALGGGFAKFAFYMPMTRAWEFGVGIIIGIGITRGPSSRVVATACCVLGLLLVGATVVLIDGTTIFPGSVALAPVGGTALLLVGGLHERSPIAQLLSIRPLVWIGDLSYSWYLWHWPPIVIARAWFPSSTALHAFAALVGLLPAWLSYRFVEQPIRQAESWRGRRAILLVLACVAISLAAAQGLSWTAARELASAPPDLVAAVHDSHGGAARGCAEGPAPGALAGCTSGSERARGAIVLVGDSNADHMVEPIEQAAANLGHPFVIAARTACPFVDALVHLPARDARSCMAYVRSMLQWMITSKPALVVIASASSVYINSAVVDIEAPDGGGAVAARDRKVALWTSGVRSVVEQLSNAGISVLVVHTIPNLPGFTLATCPYARLSRDPDACSISLSRPLVEEQQRFARDAERAAITGISKARALDLTDQLCSPTECSARRNGLWLYRDEGHLSVQGAKSLTPTFQRAIEELR